MTPKEKAQNLIHKFIEPAKSYYSDIEWKEKNYKAKQCAIIAVEEILYFMDMFNLDLEMKHQHKWWQQVKTEIENL